MKCPCCGATDVKKVAIVNSPRIILFDGREIVTRPRQCEIFRRLMQGPIYRSSLGAFDSSKMKSFAVHVSNLRRVLFENEWPCTIEFDNNIDLRERAGVYRLKWHADLTEATIGRHTGRMQ